MSAELALILLAVSGLPSFIQSFKVSLQHAWLPYLTVLHLEVNGQCRPIGTNNETAFNAVRDHRFYLNTAHPAPCSGTVREWRYCYYRPSNTDGQRYHVTWAVYRRMCSGNSTHYVAVPSSIHTEGRTRNQILNDGNFWCRDEDVTNFRIEAGDIVGACIYDPIDNDRDRRQLDIVGQTSGYSLMQMNDVSECGVNSIPSNISSSLLSTVNSRILHLNATITGLSKHAFLGFLNEWMHIYRHYIHTYHSPANYTVNN